jgi:hypothetical protein
MWYDARPRKAANDLAPDRGSFGDVTGLARPIAAKWLIGEGARTCDPSSDSSFRRARP